MNGAEKCCLQSEIVTWPEQFTAAPNDPSIFFFICKTWLALAVTISTLQITFPVIEFDVGLNVKLFQVLSREDHGITAASRERFWLPFPHTSSGCGVCSAEQLGCGFYTSKLDFKNLKISRIDGGRYERKKFGSDNTTETTRDLYGCWDARYWFLM